MMKWTARSALAACLMLVACNPSRFEKPTSSDGSKYALGDISEDRSLFFAEAENFKEKGGGDLDLKGGASKGKCLGMRWGAGATDFVSYGIDLKESSDSTILVLRAAFEGNMPQFYDVLIDGNSVAKAELRPTGGYGYSNGEWKCYSTPIGRVTRGPHTLTIRSLRDGEIVNIDCLVLGKAR